jgi:hypothetical protein
MFSFGDGFQKIVDFVGFKYWLKIQKELVQFSWIKCSVFTLIFKKLWQLNALRLFNFSFELWERAWNNILLGSFHLVHFFQPIIINFIKFRVSMRNDIWIDGFLGHFNLYIFKVFRSFYRFDYFFCLREDPTWIWWLSHSFLI